MAACATVYIQPWLGLVASFGAPAFESTRYLCLSRRVERPRGDTTRAGDKNVCGHTPLLQHLELESIANPEESSLRNFRDRPPPHPRHTKDRKWFGNTWPPSPPPPPPRPPIQTNRFGRLELLHNETGQMALLRLKHRLSTTANLLHVAKRATDGKRCGALLGVGHTRRREGDCTKQARPDPAHLPNRPANARRTPLPYYTPSPLPNYPPLSTSPPHTRVANQPPALLNSRAPAPLSSVWMPWTTHP